MGEVLGSGQFGTVVKGQWVKRLSSSKEEPEKHEAEKEEAEKEKEGTEEEAEEVEVAVKMLKEGSSAMRTIKFLREAAIMGQFNHPNVITFYGVVTEGEPVRPCMCSVN